LSIPLTKKRLDVSGGGGGGGGGGGDDGVCANKKCRCAKSLRKLALRVLFKR